MARYQGTYTDIYKLKATYNVVNGKETKTVIGESTQNYKSGMTLNINSGKLEIRAKTLLDTAKVASWDFDDSHDSKADHLSMSIYGSNVNVFGFFMVKALWMAWASGSIVTSNGVALWINANPIQVLYTVGSLSGFNEVEKTKTGKKTRSSGIRMVTVKSEHVKSNKSNVS